MIYHLLSWYLRETMKITYRFNYLLSELFIAIAFIEIVYNSK